MSKKQAVAVRARVAAILLAVEHASQWSLPVEVGADLDAIEKAARELEVVLR